MTPIKQSLLTLTVISLVAATPLVAQQTMGPDITISALDNEQTWPHVAYNNVRDQYLVVWQNFWGANRDIYAQRLDGEGNLLSSFAVSAGAGHDRVQPAVAYDDINDQYLVVWAYDYNGSAADWDIKGRRIPWNGPDPLLPEFYIDGASGSQLVPEVAFAHSQQEFMVVYYNNPGSGATNISGRRVALDGTLPDGSFVVASGATDREDPDIAYNLARNEYLVTYSLTGSNILATRLTAGGIILGGGEFGIAEWAEPESRPAVASCKGNADQYFVVWQSQQSATNNEIYGRFVSGGGVTGVVTSFDGNFQQNADVACHAPSLEYLVVYEEEYGNGALGVAGQRLTMYGTLSPTFAIRPVYTGQLEDHTRPAVAAGKDGGFLAAWEDDRAGTSFQDIHGRMVMVHLFADGFESGNVNAWSASGP